MQTVTRIIECFAVRVKSNNDSIKFKKVTGWVKLVPHNEQKAKGKFWFNDNRLCHCRKRKVANKRN